MTTRKLDEIPAKELAQMRSSEERMVKRIYVVLGVTVACVVVTLIGAALQRSWVVLGLGVAGSWATWWVGIIWVEHGLGDGPH